MCFLPKICTSKLSNKKEFLLLLISKKPKAIILAILIIIQTHLSFCFGHALPTQQLRHLLTHLCCLLNIQFLNF